MTKLVLTELDPEIQQAVAETREVVSRLHAELPKYGLVVWTAGNVSQLRPSAFRVRARILARSNAGRSAPVALDGSEVGAHHAAPQT